MKVYITADIEGTCGFTAEEEGKVGGYLYDYFRRQMSREVASACKGALQTGADSVLVHDSHDCSRNIMPELLPEKARLMRQADGSPYAMLSGIQNGGFDAVFMTGFHSGAGSNTNPVSHTFNHDTVELKINGMRLTEFMYNCYTAASLDIPVPFVCGDKALCEFAESFVPNITTVATVEGIGAGTVSPHPDAVLKDIEAGVKKALSGDWRKCKVKLPEGFTLTIKFKRHQDAFYNSFYPGAVLLDETTLQFTTNEWFEVLRAVHYILK